MSQEYSGKTEQPLEQAESNGAERNQGTASGPNEDRKKQILRISLGVGILTSILMAFLWVLHAWLGLWLLLLYEKYDSDNGRVGRWTASRLPMWLVAEGILKHDNFRYSLAYFGVRGEEGIIYLVRALSSSDSRVRFNASQSLGLIAYENKDVLPLLLDALTDENNLTRSAAAHGLGCCGRLDYATEETVAALAGALVDDDDMVRNYVENALGEIGAKAEKAVPALLAALDFALTRSDYSEASAIISVLGRIGDGAKNATSILIGLMKHDDSQVRDASGEALGRIGMSAEETVPLLIGVLKEENESSFQEATDALILIGPGAKDAVPCLIKALANESLSIRCNAAYALGIVGPETGEGIPILIECLNAKDEIMRSSAAKGLGLMGHHAKQAILPLSKALKDSDGLVRSQAAWALSEIGDQSAMTFLLNALKRETDDGVKGDIENAINRLNWILKTNTKILNPN